MKLFTMAIIFALILPTIVYAGTTGYLQVTIVAPPDVYTRIEQTAQGYQCVYSIFDVDKEDKVIAEVVVSNNGEIILEEEREVESEVDYRTGFIEAEPDDHILCIVDATDIIPGKTTTSTSEYDVPQPTSGLTGFVTAVPENIGDSSAGIFSGITDFFKNSIENFFNSLFG